MSKIKEILVLHHSHFDMGYTHPQPVILALQTHYIDQALDLCELTEEWPEQARFRWTCESTYVVLKWLETASDRQISRLFHYLHNCQFSITASMMHITPLCSAEEIARTLYPINQLRKLFGIKLKAAIHHDVNGQPWSYAQMMLDAGIEFFIMGVNIHFGGIPLTRPLAFHWQVPDGRKLLTYHGEHYSLFSQFADITTKNTTIMAQGLTRYLQRIEEMQEYPFDFVYLTATNPPLYDNNSPDRELAGLIRQWNVEGREQTISFVTPEQLLARVQPHTHRLSTYAGDWTDYWNFGAASSARETKLSRHTKQGMKVVELLDAFQPMTEQRFKNSKSQAWENILLYDEHTWGAYNSVTEPRSLNATVQWMHKAHYAYQAHSLTSYLAGSKLEQVTGNPLQSEEPAGLMLINPSPVALTHELRLPPYFASQGRHLAGHRMMSQSWMNGEPVEGGSSYGLVELPAFSWRKIPLTVLQQATVSPDMTVAEGRIETPFHTCTFDSSTGRITGLYDKKLDWQMLDESSPWTLFQYVQETIDPLFHAQHRSTFFPRDIDKGNNSISVWNHEWQAKRQTCTRMLACSVEQHEHSVTLVIQWEAPGVDELEQRFTFYSYRPEIEMRATLQKQAITTPEGNYFALPLNLETWRCHFDTAGQWVELDEQQLPGASRDWVTVDTSVAVYDELRGVTLACPDAPLVQVGDFQFGKEQKAIPRNPRPLLLAWPMNNYWDTNFCAQQPGFVSFTYTLSTFQHFEPMRALTAGIQAATPVILTPVVTCEEEASGQWINVEGENVVLFDVKPAACGEGILLRLKNTDEAGTDVQISFPSAQVQSAWLTDVLEEDQQQLDTLRDGAIDLKLDGWQMAYLRVLLSSE